MGDIADFYIEGMMSDRSYVDTCKPKRRNKSMIKESRVQCTCPFCGHEYTVTYSHDDGYDYDGHQRGHVKEYAPEGKCYCDTARALKNLKVKPMCMNCTYLCESECSCTNPKRIAEVKRVMSNIQVQVSASNLKVLDKKKSCNQWKFDTDTIMNYVTANNIEYKSEPVPTGEKVNPKKELFKRGK